MNNGKRTMLVEVELSRCLPTKRDLTEFLIAYDCTVTDRTGEMISRQTVAAWLIAIDKANRFASPKIVTRAIRAARIDMRIDTPAVPEPSEDVSCPKGISKDLFHRMGSTPEPSVTKKRIAEVFNDMLTNPFDETPAEREQWRHEHGLPPIYGNNETGNEIKPTWAILNPKLILGDCGVIAATGSTEEEAWENLEGLFARDGLRELKDLSCCKIVWEEK